MKEKYDDFLDRVRHIGDIGGALALLAWDQEVFLPPKGVPARARHKATLAAIHHDCTVDETLGALISDLQGCELGDFEAANVREMKRLRDRAVKIPKRLVTELTEAGSLAQQAWAQAREKDDWPLFAPHLEKLVALKREEAEAVGYAGEPYNALLDEFEPGARVEDLAQVFGALREALIPLLEKIAAADNPPDDALLRKHYGLAEQEALGRRVLRDMGFDFEAGRLDVSTHPFTEGMSPRDVRITARYGENELGMGLYSNLHEGGHALYEMGLPEQYDGTPVGQAVSLGIHESQSRLWENCVGRSREFFVAYGPVLREMFPEQLGSATSDDLYRAVNVVRPSLIRVEADEVTYNLHIILRLEIERALLRGEIEVADLPALWREKTSTYLGLTVPSDAQGVLQDIHWAFGVFGYFPTYTLGNLYAAQFFAVARQQIADLPGAVAGGEFASLLTWLRANIHRKGSLLRADELCREVSGESLSIDPFVAYLREKFAAIYGF